VHMTRIKKAEDSEKMIIRLVEVEGKEKELKVTLPEDVQSVRKLNLVELPIDEDTGIVIRNNSITMDIKPHEIVTLAIKLR
jgi:alpha-mannosidase